MSHDRCTIIGSVLGPSENLLHNCCLGIGIVLHVSPRFGRELAFCSFIQKPITFIATQPITENEHAFNFRTSIRKAVQVDLSIWSFEEPVLVPIWFTGSKDIACSFQVRNVGTFVASIGDHKQNIDDWLRRESGYRAGTDMFEKQDPRAKSTSDSIRF